MDYLAAYEKCRLFTLTPELLNQNLLTGDCYAYGHLRSAVLEDSAEFLSCHHHDSNSCYTMEFSAALQLAALSFFPRIFLNCDKKQK